MALEALSGHGITLGVETDPVGSPNTFDLIGQINGDVTWPSMTLPETEVTPHEAGIDQWIVGVKTRGPMEFSINYVFNNSSHDENTGLISFYDDRLLRGWQFRGPGGGVGSHEIILSAYVTNLQPSYPVRTGAITSPVTLRPSGPMVINAVTVGT